jgi:hypothetical protein
MDYIRKIKNWGFVLLAIWLILWGALSLLSISFPAMGVVLELLAIAAGILILLKK